MKIIRLISIVFLVFIQIVYSIPISVFAQSSSFEKTDEFLYNFHNEDMLDTGILYLNKAQDECGTWGDYGKFQTAEITNILEYIYNIHQNTTVLNDLVNSAADYFYTEDAFNVDELSRYLLFDMLNDERYIDCILNSQNPDGGFGLSEGYASDIIDIKLALKTLADLNETKAMDKAAVYIASLQMTMVVFHTSRDLLLIQN